MMNIVEGVTVILLFIFLQGTFLIDLYVREGETVNLTCQMKIAMDDLSWRGPPNLTLYASGSDKCNLTNIQLSHLEKTKENILKIFKFAAKNEGNYQCSSFDGYEMFNVKLLQSPNVSIVADFKVGDGIVILSCLASDGVPDNYSYEWEHRTYANDHIRFLSSKPDIIIENDTRRNNGVYICRVFNSFGQTQKSHRQIAEYNLSIPAVPQFVYSNTKEHIVYLNEANELKVYYTAIPVANVTILEDNQPVSNSDLNKSDMLVSVKNATVVDYIYDKSVNVHGYEITLWMLIQNRLEFSNITVLLQNDIGLSNHTIQVKVAKKTVKKDKLVGNTQILTPLITVFSLVLVAAFAGLKLVCSKYTTNSCENNTVTPNGIISENDYDASAPQRQNEVQVAFVNDIYGDVRQMEAVSTQNGLLIPPQRTVFQDHSCSSERVSRIKENKELNYIEVDLNQNSNHRRHIIHTDNRTPYADVDLTIKVDPLPDTDSESDGDNTS